MTGPITTVNYIKPTISANPILERVVLVAVALMAVGAAVLSIRDARAAYVRELGIEAVAQALDMERSAQRDRLLDSAQDRLTEALDVYSRDPVLWRAMALTRYLQATGAQVTDVSPPLLRATVDAARHAEALDPHDPEAPGRIAQALSVLPQADKAQAAAALKRSYLQRALDPASGAWRIQTAAALWPALDAETRESALAEACIIARGGAAGQTQMQTIAAADPGMAAAWTTVTQQTSCAYGGLIQSPGN